MYAVYSSGKPVASYSVSAWLNVDTTRYFVEGFKVYKLPNQYKGLVLLAQSGTWDIDAEDWLIPPTDEITEDQILALDGVEVIYPTV